VILVLFILGVFRVLSEIIRRRFQPSAELLTPLHHIVYFCRYGHHLGRRAPEPHTLCQRCIDEGLIRFFCEIDQQHPHELPIVSTRPPFARPCPRHGTGEIKYTINGRTVSEEEWWEHHAPQPLELPLPNSDPLPEDIARAGPAWKFPPEMSRRILQLLVDPAAYDNLAEDIEAQQTTMEELGKRADRLNQDLDDRIKEIEKATDRGRADLSRRLVPAFGAIALLLLALIFLVPTLSTQPQTSEDLVETWTWITLATLQFLGLILVLFFALLLVLLLYKRGSGALDLQTVLYSFLLSELLAVLIFPLVFGVPMTLHDVLQALLFDFLAEAIVFLVEFVASLRKMRQHSASLTRDKNLVSTVQSLLQRLSEGLEEVLRLVEVLRTVATGVGTGSQGSSPPNPPAS